jgi:hypothetical protein
MSLRDPHPFARGGSVAIVSTSIMHMMQAAMMWEWPSAAGSTGLIAVIHVMGVIGAPESRVFAGSVMMLSAGMALIGAYYRLGYVRLLLFTLQHFVLGVMAAGGVWAVVRGRYLDGTVIPAPHIFTDQCVLIALFVIHTSAIIRRCRDPNG